MSDRVYTFYDGFQNRNSARGQERATVNLATNTLRMKVPADDEVAMTKAAAHVLPEESLHGDWDVGVIHTLGQLTLTADRALERGIDAAGEAGALPAEHEAVMRDCERTIAALLEPMTPFVEAVDKFQILSVLSADTAIEAAFRDSVADQVGEEAAERFSEEFRQTIQEELDVASGAIRPSADVDSYVNPVYFHALSHIAQRDWSDDTDREGGASGSRDSDGRAVAEAVARATLDVPVPIAPLGTTQYSSFESLSLPEVDGDPLDVETLIDGTTYDMTRTQYRDHIVPCLEDIEAEGFEFDYGEASRNWVTRVFVNVLDALSELDADDSVVVGEMDRQALQDELVRRAHGVDPTSVMTMRDCSTVMFDVPRQTTPVSYDEDIMTQEGPPLPKILMASFEQHGSFAGVVYDLTETETKHELNWYVETESFSLSEDRHVPDHVEAFPALWRHVNFWHGMRQFARSGYWDLVRERLADRYETLAAFDDALAALPVEDVADASVDDDGGYTEVTSDNKRRSHRSPGPSAGGKLTMDRKIRDRLDATRLPALRELADKHGLGPDQLSVDDIQCPLCAIYTSRCGGDGDCARRSDIERVLAHLPALVGALPDSE
jgi:hypothetical protein